MTQRAKGTGRSVVTLSDDWRMWIVDNALAGVARNKLVETLGDGGVSGRLARREVDAILSSPAFVASRAIAQRAERLDLIVRLLHDPRSPIERRPTVCPPEFFARYYDGSVPVILTEATAGWPARAWTPTSLRARFGDVDIDVTVGREGDRDYDENFTALTRTMPFAELVDRVTAAGESNDIYLIARNRALRRGAFAPLLDDIAADPEIFDRAALPRGSSLWFGPAGTMTQLHHDTCNIFLCQMYGRKRIDLVPPTETAAVHALRGFYVQPPPDDAAVAKLAHHTLELRPGEALFIPAGWFHRVRALDVSITVSLLNFRRPNDLDWYRPGFVAERRGAT